MTTESGDWSDLSESKNPNGDSKNPVPGALDLEPPKGFIDLEPLRRIQGSRLKSVRFRKPPSEDVWAEIERLYRDCVPVEALALLFRLTPDQVSERAANYEWPIRKGSQGSGFKVTLCHNDGAAEPADLPAVAVAAAELVAVERGVTLRRPEKEKAGIDWAAAQEKVRETVYEKAIEALGAAELEPPTTWKEAEIADRMARRAAGLEDKGAGAQVIIPINSAFSHSVERDI